MHEFFKKIVEIFNDSLGWVYNKLIPEVIGRLSLGKGFTLEILQKMTGFVLQIFARWYFFVAIAALVVVYRLFKALEGAGIIAGFERILLKTMDSVFYISEVCFPQIIHLKDFLGCISGAP